MYVCSENNLSAFCNECAAQQKNTFLNWNVRLQNVKGSQHLVLEQVAGGLRQDWYQECGILHSTQMPFLMRHAKFERSFTIYDNPYRGSKHGQLLKQHPLLNSNSSLKFLYKIENAEPEYLHFFIGPPSTISKNS